ncbi:MAG TPA: Hpt domain-containing protein, partial [Pyrinomonadaceae bacterium]|nr:Hpt domain-containing protein [Pyrinomonadaceae bacterium]
MDNQNPDNRGEFFDQFLDDYYAECDEHLVSIRRSLVTLEDEVDTGTVDRTLLDNLFRSFHTLKGISGMVGLSAAEQLAHHLESYLRELREGTVQLSDSGFQALVSGVSLLERVINARRSDQPIPSIDETVERLQAVSSESATSKTSEPQTSESEVNATRWLIEFTPTAELAERGVNVNSVRSRLQEIGQLIQAKPV